MPNIESEIPGADEMFADLKELANAEPVTATVYVDDPEAVNYWGVLDAGSHEGSRPWPSAGKKTTEKDGRIFSKQAPGGFATKYFKQFLGFFGHSVMTRMRAKNSALNRADMRAAVKETGEYVHDVVTRGVPQDSGRLKNSIKLKIEG